MYIWDDSVAKKKIIRKVMWYISMFITEWVQENINDNRN